MDYKIIGSRIRTVRLNHGMKQDEFAEKIGVNRHSLSRIESGKQQPPLEMLVALWGTFKVDANWILDGVEKSSHGDIEHLRAELETTKTMLAVMKSDRDTKASFIQLLQKTAGLI